MIGCFRKLEGWNLTAIVKEQIVRQQQNLGSAFASSSCVYFSLVLRKSVGQAWEIMKLQTLDPAADVIYTYFGWFVVHKCFRFFKE